MTTDRFNLYQAVHKGLRAFMTDTLVRVGHTDPTDVQECTDCAEQVRTLLHVCGEHLVHENRFIHTALERRAPGNAQQAESDHADHVAEIAALRAVLAQAEVASPSERDAHWLRLYHEMSQFISDNLTHMLLEEQAHNAVLWAHYSDDELIALHDELVASIPPDEMALHVRWILPSVSHAERVGMLQGMRQGMPPEVFASQLDMARPLLQARDWLKLKAAFQEEVAVPQEMLA
ncbi:MAG: hypothetical protein WAV91_13110 [Aquabacterium sp.]